MRASAEREPWPFQRQRFPFVLSRSIMGDCRWRRSRATPPAAAQPFPLEDRAVIVSGFSGNEMFCLAEKGWAPGSIVVGNSVQSLGFVGGIASGLRTIAGGEIAN